MGFSLRMESCVSHIERDAPMCDVEELNDELAAAITFLMLVMAILYTMRSSLSITRDYAYFT